MIQLLQNFFWGIIMAFGELLPGVGMQTVAIIAGLYDDMITFFYEGTEFLKAIGLFIVGKAKKEDIVSSFLAIKWKFGIPVAVGLVLTIVALSHTVASLFDTFPTQVAAVSFGIVVASVAIPYKELETKTWKELLLFLATFTAFYSLFSINTTDIGATEPALLIFFGGGLLASLAGFLPGISISFALLIMGLYRPLLSSVDAITSGYPTLYSFLTLILFFTGLGIGMLITVRALSFLIEKYKSLLLAFIIGLILASLRAIWPFTTRMGDLSLPWQMPLPQFTEQLIYITIAFVVVTSVRKLAENKGTLASSFGPKERTVIQS